MKLTCKAIARMSGFAATYWWNGSECFGWVQINRNELNFVLETCHASFDTEQEAYEHCCRVCGLVEFEEGE